MLEVFKGLFGSRKVAIALVAFLAVLAGELGLPGPAVEAAVAFASALIGIIFIQNVAGIVSGNGN